MKLLDKILEKTVKLPSPAPNSLIEAGIQLVRRLIEEKRLAEEKRRAEEREREELERSKGEIARSLPMFRRASETRFSIASGVRWSRAASVELPPCAAIEVKRRPPDMHAPVLSFSARLLKYVNECFGGKAPEVYKRAGIDRKLYSKIVSDDRATVSKQTALQLAIGLQLNGKELDDFLHAAGYALSPTVPTDRAFMYCLDNKILNIFDVNRIMVESGLPDLRIKF